jgi:twitching motility protein PilT
MDFQLLLRFAVQNGASDIHIQAGIQPHLRIGGMLKAIDQPAVSDEQAHAFIDSIAPPHMHGNLDQRLSAGMDFSYAIPGLSRFRCSAYRHLSTAGISMRIIRTKISSIAELHLPSVIGDIGLSERGLTLVAGTTGSGKSTTLAAMISLIDQTRSCKMITIEDPVEYLHSPKRAVIAQLEVGTDTPSFEQALRQSLRQDPDLVLVGELRDTETLRIALRAADTGHQVFSTVHSANAPQTIERIIAMFPAGEHKLLLAQLAGNLEAIIAQRLVICRDGSRRPAVEVLRGGPVVGKFILENKVHELAEYMRQGGSGQQTFDQHLLSLCQQEVITVHEALRNSTNRDSLAVALRGISAKVNDNNHHAPARQAHAPATPAPAHN